MSKVYSPGDDADAIIARQVAKGNFASADAVVRMIEEYEAEFLRLRVKIADSDAAYQRGNYRKSTDAEAMKADLVYRGEMRSRQEC